jgi:hypothetical protein
MFQPYHISQNRNVYFNKLQFISSNFEQTLACSVTRYFARQLLNKHAKNYQNVEKITKFLLSTEVVWKSIKHLSKTKSEKRFPSLKLCFFHVFLSHLYFLIAIVQNANMAPQWSSSGPGSLARNQHRVRTIDIYGEDSLGQQLAIWMYSFAGMDLQLFSWNIRITGCVFLAYLVEFHMITKILLTFREITK